MTRDWITVVGRAYAYLETGTEGVMWAVQEDGKPGYAGLHCIEPGDHLTITSPMGDILVFGGTIEADREAGWTEFHLRPGYGKPSAFGWWIHWTQTGWDPEAWAILFWKELPATLMTHPLEHR